MRLTSLLAAALAAGCLFENEANRGSVVDNEVRVGILYLADGSPAVGARVEVYPVDHVPKAEGLPKTSAAGPTLATRTDAEGRYRLDSLPVGTYNLLGELDGAYAYQDSIVFSSGSSTLANRDTLRAPGTVTGMVALEPNHDRRTAFVQVLGTGIFANADSSGRFTLGPLAAGEYSLRVITIQPHYAPYFSSVRIRSGGADTLDAAIAPVYTGIPVVRSLRGTYDTARQVARLSWSSSPYAFLKEYLVYRTDADALDPVPALVGRTADTAFADSLAALAAASPAGAPPRVEYTVRVRNQSGQEGLPFRSVVLAAAPVDSVRTYLSLLSDAGEPAAYSVNDRAEVILAWSNATRGNDSLFWFGPEGRLLARKAVAGREGADTLRLALPAGPGPFEVSARMLDAAGDAWTAFLPLSVELDPPEVEAGPDTTVSLGDTVVLRGSATDRFGAVVRREWDIGPDGRFAAQTAPEIRIAARTSPGLHNFVFRATDDDGNQALDTLRAWVEQDPPTAMAGPDTTVSVRDTVILRGRAHDRLGRIVRLEWSRGPGEPFVEEPEAGFRLVADSAPGGIMAVLRATDDDGNVAVDTVGISWVDDRPSVALVVGGHDLQHGAGYTFSTRVSDRGRIVKWEWSTDTTGTFRPGSRGDTAFIPRAPMNGNLKVRVRATDDDGNVTIASADVLVTPWIFVKTNGTAIAPMTTFEGRLVVSHRNPWGGTQTFDARTGEWSMLPYHSWSMGVFDEQRPFVESKKLVAADEGIYSLGAYGVNYYSKALRRIQKHGEVGAYRTELASAFLDGQLYIAGGGLGLPYSTIGLDFKGVTLRAFGTFNNFTGKIDSLPDLPIPLYRLELVACGGKLFAFAGRTGEPGEGNRRMFAFDPDAGAWEEKAPLPISLSAHPPNSWSAVSGGKIYAGRNENVVVYDPSTDRWAQKVSKIPNYPYFNDVEATTLEGRIFLLDVDGTSLLVYNPEEDP